MRRICSRVNPWLVDCDERLYINCSNRAPKLTEHASPHQWTHQKINHITLVDSFFCSFVDVGITCTRIDKQKTTYDSFRLRCSFNSFMFFFFNSLVVSFSFVSSVVFNGQNRQSELSRRVHKYVARYMLTAIRQNRNHAQQTQITSYFSGTAQH